MLYIRRALWVAGIVLLALFCSCPVLAQIRRPAVSFNMCGYEAAQKLTSAGFALGVRSSAPLSLPALQRYNVVVISGLGQTNADGSLPPTVKQDIETLRRYLEAGGGVLVLPYYNEMLGDLPPQVDFLKPLGLVPLFDERIEDPKNSAQGTAWDIRFAHTTAVAEAPITRGVEGLWYPNPPDLLGGKTHTVPCAINASWTVAVSGEASSFSLHHPIDNDHLKEPGRYASSVPLVAYRQVGKGRIVYLGIAADYLYETVPTTTLESIVLERGLNNRPSDGLKLFTNCLNWLAEPSLAAGSLGGATTDRSLLENPYRIKLVAPFAWNDKVAFPAPLKRYPGVVGARTRYSSGNATPEDWIKKAKARGLCFIVFLEEFRKLSPERFEQLKADCVRLTTPDFAAIPGFTIDDEIGNHYLYCGATFPYPDKKFLSPDGKTFHGYIAQAPPGSPEARGQLAMTTLEYAYGVSNFRLTAGNYLYRQGAAPFADWFSDWDVMGVVTTRDGKLLEDATTDFLKLSKSGQDPVPLAITLMDDPSALDREIWRTVLCLPENGGTIVSGNLNKDTKLVDFFSLWHSYPNNPCTNYITSGPTIAYWGYCGPRDYEGSLPGDYVWQNYRWKLKGQVASSSGLKEVDVYDGPTLFRRYLPGGRKAFEFHLDLVHDRQHTLSLIVTDLAGGKAISNDHWDRNHRLEEFMCADRNNQLTYGLSSRKDGTGVLVGGSQMLATPCKRLGNNISPSGTFKSDSLLGAPAFDGGAGGEPQVFENVIPITPVRATSTPNVTEAVRLLATRDVNIGAGIRENTFVDTVPVLNVWSTLWKTEPSPAYHVTRRNTYFQADPDSPLAVFLWQIDIRLVKDIPNKGFEVLALNPFQARRWMLRGSDGSVHSGNWEQGLKAPERTLTTPFSQNAYAYCADSPLGSAAVYPLTDGLDASLSLPKKNSVLITLPAHSAPQKRGETRHIEVLLLGVPRVTEVTRNLPASVPGVAERFYRDFGLDGGKTGYTLKLVAGRPISKRYILRIDGSKDGAFSGQMAGMLISSLPIAVGGLHENWTACLYDRGLHKARPVGVLEGVAWVTVVVNGKTDLFVGHPVMADSPALTLQVTQSGENAWTLEAHNPTDRPITSGINLNPYFDPFYGKTAHRRITVPAGSSVFLTL